MSAVTDFTQDQIEKMMAAPMLVSMYVMGTSVSGPIGLVKEMMAGVETAMKAGKDAPMDSLLRALFSEDNMKAQQDKMQQETKESTKGAQDMAQAKEKIVADLKVAVGIVDAKASAEEASMYKALMVKVAENVANAAKEGGFMGIGGVLVNDAEKQAIQDISEAVNNPTPFVEPAPEAPATEAAAPAAADAPAAEAPAADASAPAAA